MRDYAFHKIKQQLPPTILTIFGATGDLAANYLMPALFHLSKSGILPKDFRLVCAGRKGFDSKRYFEFILKKSPGLKKIVTAQSKKQFLKHIKYYQGSFEDPKSFIGLAELIKDQGGTKHKCYNRLYYFATSPEFFSFITKILKSAKLLEACIGHERNVRVLIEKPFGYDLLSAKKLNQLLLKYFKENQIYRIDHYQGKETVQNLIVARFGNTLFEPLWNGKYVDHVEISVLYNDTVGHRANFYDKAGALRDVVQNHALMMMALIAMNEPRELTTEDLRQEKFNILKALRPFNKKNIKTNAIRGQYAGYKEELGKASQTETFAALKVFIDNPRWEGVPFYIRTGKAMGKRATEISIHFKELPRCLFKGCAANVLTFRIQPDESVKLQINNKIPGFGISLHQSSLDFSFGNIFKGEIPSAYERLLLDFMEGDQRLFIRSDEIEAAWKFVDSIIKNWKNLPLYIYPKNSFGPKEAESFIQKDLREWRTK